MLPFVDNVFSVANFFIFIFCYLYCSVPFYRNEISNPLITCFTPTYNTGVHLQRPYYSLLAQTYQNWEWIVIDDSPDGEDETWEQLQEMAKSDYRIKVFRGMHTGNIGETKRQAAMMGRGEVVFELDHDDELTDNCLRDLANAIVDHPECGFFYSDFAECTPEGDTIEYGGGWGWGEGSYRREVYKGRTFAVVNAPPISPKSIRHIISAPNHFRVWRKSLYCTMTGHSKLHVADDYEIMVRTFLATRMCHIPSFCYIQYRNPEGNTHKTRNMDIQRHVRYCSQLYDGLINERIESLGFEDYVYEEGKSYQRLLSIPLKPVPMQVTANIRR